MRKLIAQLNKNHAGLTAVLVALFLQTLTGCLTTGVQTGGSGDFSPSSYYQSQSSYYGSSSAGPSYDRNSYGGSGTYSGYARRPFNTNYSNNPYGAGYGNPYASPYDYGRSYQSINGSYNQSPTAAYLDQNGTEITPLRTYLRDNLDQAYITPSTTLYRPTGGFDVPNRSWDTWPSYTPSVQ